MRTVLLNMLGRMRRQASGPSKQARAGSINPLPRPRQEKEVAPVIAGFWERAEFPHHLIPRLAMLGLGGGTLKGYGCPGQSVLGAAMGVIETARVDGSISTFFLVHNALAALTIGARPVPSDGQRSSRSPGGVVESHMGC